MVEIGQLGVGSVYLKERGEHGTLKYTQQLLLLWSRGFSNCFDSRSCDNPGQKCEALVWSWCFYLLLNYFLRRLIEGLIGLIGTNTLGSITNALGSILMIVVLVIAGEVVLRVGLTVGCFSLLVSFDGLVSAV